MKKRTHYQIARLSVENNENIDKFTFKNQVQKWAFYFGTILPDLTITQFRHPHFYRKSYDYVFNKLDQMEEKAMMRISDAIKLGEIVHYLSDFCCYAHIGGSIGKVSEHIRYEKNIHQYVMDNYHKLQNRFSDNRMVNADYNNVINLIKNELSDYKTMEPSFDLDIKKSINISKIIYFGILLNQNKVNRNLPFHMINEGL